MPSTRDRLSRLTRPVRRAVLRRRRLLAAALTAIAVGAGIHATTSAPPALVGVQVAAHDLSPGVVLADGDLTTAQFAPGSVPERLAAAPLGRTLAAPLRAGEPLTDVRLVGPGLAGALSGRTAVPVRLPDAEMASLLHAGDRIDLVATDPEGSGARVVASDALVLAVPRVAGSGAVGSPSGLSGDLVVVAITSREVNDVSDAAVRFFLTFIYTH